jgi:PleD family two-component response regulator
MGTPATTPLVLLGCTDEWLSRSFESVFEQHGYGVERVRTGARALRIARSVNPDVVVLEEGNGDLDALAVCAALGNDPLFDHMVPIVVTSATPVTPETRHSAYAAGAWEYCSHPVDLEALMLKLATFQRARSEAITKRGERFLDGETGLYTKAAFERLAEQVGARAVRRHEPLACISIAVQQDGVPSAAIRADARDDQHETFATLADVCRSQSRKSDIVAHLSDSRLVILAPDTDGDGARLLVGRLRRALSQASRTAMLADGGIRAGYSAVSDLAESGLEPGELVRRASSAPDQLHLADYPERGFRPDDVP